MNDSLDSSVVMRECVDCGQVEEPEDGRYCPECGVHFRSALHDYSAPSVSGVCIGCGSRSPSYFRRCWSCVRSGTEPEKCSRCGVMNPVKADTNAGWPALVQCSQCNSRLEFPVGLADFLVDVSHGKPGSAQFGQLDLEWLFFIAMAYQYNHFGGSGLYLTLSDEGLEIYEQYFETDLETAAHVNWPRPLDQVHRRDLLDLFERYEERLWTGETHHEDGQFVEVSPYPIVDTTELQSPEVRKSLSDALALGDFGQLSWLAPVVRDMLESEQYFS